MRALGKLDGAEHVGRLVDKISGEEDAVDKRLVVPKCSAGLVGIGTVHDKLS